MTVSFTLLISTPESSVWDYQKYTIVSIKLDFLLIVCLKIGFLLVMDHFVNTLADHSLIFRNKYCL